MGAYLPLAFQSNVPRRSERVVDDQGDAVRMGNACQRVDVGEVGCGIAQRLDEDGLRVVLNGRLDLAKIVRVDERGVDAVERQRVLEQVEASAVDGLLGHDVLTGLRERLNSVRDSRSACRNCQRGHTALEGRNALLEHVLRGIRQTSVDIARVGETEARGSMFGIVEHVRGGLVNRHRARVGYGVGLFLADMELEGFKSVVRHGWSPL